MLGKTEKNPQLNLLDVPLVHFINQEHELCQFAKKIDWEAVEKDFAAYYSTTGAPSVPLRTMIGLNMLKMVFEHGDKAVLDHWLENPYWQHFCGEVSFKNQPPCSVSEFNHFRKRVGKEGEEKIMKIALSTFGKARIDKGTRALERRKRGARGSWRGIFDLLGLRGRK
jgi:transposase, IS5 family